MRSKLTRVFSKDAFVFRCFLRTCGIKREPDDNFERRQLYELDCN